MAKNYEDLTFREDYMFCITQPAHPDITRRMAELVTGRKAVSDANVRNQLPNRISLDGKGVRFDVQYEGKEQVIDFEMQNRKRKGLGKRIRYYQSMLDGTLLKRKQEYVQRKDSYIVFVCLYDPFGKGKLKYSFRHTCRKDPALVLSAGANIIV